MLDHLAQKPTAGIFAVRKFKKYGELAQLARALAWHARGRRFDSDILHKAYNM
jgi:hypothetical protein